MLPRLSTTPRAALHSANGRSGSKRHRVWTRDLTAWLALGLSIAAVMFVVARASTASPRASIPPTATAIGRQPPSGSTPRGTSVTIVDRRPLRTVKARPSAVTRPATGSLSATTSTLVAPPATTPTPALASDVAVVREEWAGDLTYPDDVATSYSFTTTGGVVTVAATHTRGTRRLWATLRCGDLPAVRTSRTAPTTMRAPAGSCTYNLALASTAFGSGEEATYQITAHYPAVVPPT